MLRQLKLLAPDDLTAFEAWLQMVRKPVLRRDEERTQVDFIVGARHGLASDGVK